jgi:hypothetical protein
MLTWHGFRRPHDNLLLPSQFNSARHFVQQLARVQKQKKEIGVDCSTARLAVTGDARTHSCITINHTNTHTGGGCSAMRPCVHGASSESVRPRRRRPVRARRHQPNTHGRSCERERRPCQNVASAELVRDQRHDQRRQRRCVQRACPSYSSAPPARAPRSAGRRQRAGRRLQLDGWVCGGFMPHGA